MTGEDLKDMNRVTKDVALPTPGKLSNGAIIGAALTEKDRADMIASRSNLAEGKDDQENSIAADLEVDPLTGAPSFHADYKNKGLDLYADASMDKIKIGVSKKFD